jgi:hypothetical protein
MPTNVWRKNKFAHEKMQQINVAYGVLSNNALREEYDFSLWQQDRADKDASYAEEFRDYVPRGTRANPDSQTAWQKYYGKRKKPSGIFTGKPKSGRARKIMKVVWALKIGIPAVLLVVIFGVVFRVPFMLDVMDRIYGRGTPAEVTKMYFNSIKEENFERTLQLSSSGMISRYTEMMGFAASLGNAYSFEADGIPYGEIWFGNTAKELSFKVIKTERSGFSLANVTVEITNLNIEKIFTLTQLEIERAVKTGTGRMILLNAINEQNLSLVPEVYRVYFGETKAITTNEYITTTIVIQFTRPGNNWVVRNVDDLPAFRSVILGGFDNRDLSSYLQIDWHDVLRIM